MKLAGTPRGASYGLLRHATSKSWAFGSRGCSALQRPSFMDLFAVAAAISALLCVRNSHCLFILESDINLDVRVNSRIRYVSYKCSILFNVFFADVVKHGVPNQNPGVVTGPFSPFHPFQVVNFCR